MEIPRFSSMRARNERENKGKKGANYWSTWRKTKDAVGGDEGKGENDRKADSCGETENNDEERGEREEDRWKKKKKKRREEIGRTERKRKREGRGDERNDARARDSYSWVAARVTKRGNRCECETLVGKHQSIDARRRSTCQRALR